MEKFKAVLLIILNLLGIGGSMNYPENERVITYSAWVAHWEENKAYKSFQNTENLLTEVLPLWYSIDHKGALQSIKPFQWTTEIKVIPSISNNFDPDRTKLLISNPDKVDEFVKKLVSEAQKYGFSGWDLDFEQINAQDANIYSEFVNKTAQKLHANNLTLSVTLHARTGEPSDWKESLGHDYQTLGKSAADRIRIMAYDYHSSATSAGAITPIDWLEKVIRYAQSYIPAEKLVIALPTYGYDWTSGTGKPLNYEDVKSLDFQRDSQSGELATNLIWVQDSESIAMKVAVVKRLGINNICFWKLGSNALDTFLLSQQPQKE